jgi:hypothetical protein
MGYFKENYNGMFIRFRQRRLKRFYELLGPFTNVRLLDIGGMLSTWNEESKTSERFPITLVNVRKLPQPEDKRFTVMEGDALNLKFPDKSFNIAFSNSVIEHLGTWEKQVQFASEARRIADKLWIQTPARCFPIEPHYLAPFIHWFPRNIQRRLIRNFTVWGWNVRPTPARTDEILDELRLLNFEEFQSLFPDCRILKEKFMGITKSYIAVRT